MRAATRTGSNSKSLLDDAIFTRVIRQHYDSSTWNSGLNGLIECVRQNIKFSVDLDADGLECAFRRVAATSASGRWNSARADLR